MEAKEVVVAFGHPVYSVTMADPRNKVINKMGRGLSIEASTTKMFTLFPHRILLPGALGGLDGLEEREGYTQRGR